MFVRVYVFMLLEGKLVLPTKSKNTYALRNIMIIQH